MAGDRRSLLKSVSCRLAYGLPLVAALIIVLVAGLSGFLGVDADSKWGEVRLITLGAGLVVIGLAAGDRLLAAIDRRLLERDRPRTEPDIAADERAPGHVRRPSVTRRLLLFLFLGLTLATYLGLVTVWNWPRWPKSTFEYGSLAEAFSHGELSLPILPDPGLAKLSNPYDPAAREDMKVEGDLSYFNGRYYMYWGPTPAALSAIWLVVGGSPISDALIVLLSLSLVFLFSVLIVLRIRREYFRRSPDWLSLGGLVLVATAHPILWTLNSPSIYTAAISSGQAFFIGGLYFMLTGLISSRSGAWEEVGCGILWALAIGCRLTLLVAIGPLVLLLIAFRLRSPSAGGGTRGELARITRTLAPLVIGIAILGAYNFARFGDPLETGFRYQMVGDDQGQAIRQGLVFNPRYIVPNLLDYLVTPIRVIRDFPFIRPWYEAYPPFASFLARFRLPEAYSVQNAAGLAFVTPALLLGALLLVRALSCPSGAAPDPMDARNGSARRLTLRHVVLILAVAALALAGPTFLYKVAEQRFLMEVTPTFAILSAVGAFCLYHASDDKPARRAAIVVLVTSTIVFSALVGFLLALNGAGSRFDDVNPRLYAFLVGLFSR
jgi:hypothetical protein